MDSDLRDRLLLSIEEDRLALVCGAGLSMSDPTCLPSAAALAAECASHYEAVTGTSLPPATKIDIEQLAEHLSAIDRFGALINYMRWGPFRRSRVNLGHMAVADFLSCSALALAVSANFDVHIEAASLVLGEEDFQSSLDGTEALGQTLEHQHLLKLHGCCERDRFNTLWCHSQLASNPTIRDRVESSAQWLHGELAGKDLIVVGFWTDWGYLNDVLSECLNGPEPRTVIVVDPAAPEDLESKAPALWQWAHQAGVTFVHVAESADRFLDDLRDVFSRRFIDRLFTSGAGTFQAVFGAPEPARGLPDDLTTDDLYRLRRDFTGVPGCRPVRKKQHDGSMHLAAAYWRALVRAGASLRGPILSLGNESVRVVHTPNGLMSDVQAEFEEDLSSCRECDVVVCVGAIDSAAPGDLIRGAQEGSFIRPRWDGEWLTRESAHERFGI